MDEVAVSIRNLKKSFGERVILDGIHLDIRRGEIMYIIGKSGSGKSVTLKHITALLYPDEGEVLIDGQNIFTLNEKDLIKMRKKMGVLFQMAALFDSMTVFDNVAFLLKRFTNLSAQEIAQKVRARLELVGLSHVENLKPADLSGGMQKRVGLARAIALDPEIVLYDEPTTGVDPILAAAVDDLILKLNRQLKVTSIVISHDMESVFRVADRVAMLYEGRFRLVGTPQDFKQSQDPVIRQFVEGTARGPISIL